MFLKYAKDIFQSFIYFSVPKNAPKHKNRKPHFPQLETMVFSEKSHSAEKGTFSSKSYLFLSRNRLLKRERTLRPNESFVKNAQSQKIFKVWSSIEKKAAFQLKMNKVSRYRNKSRGDPLASNDFVSTLNILIKRGTTL